MRAQPITGTEIDFATAKAQARKAYQAARKQRAIPTALLDKWMADTLVACQGAPEHVQVTMLRRTATLFVLLVDRTRWLNRDAAKANAASRASASDARRSADVSSRQSNSRQDGGGTRTQERAGSLRRRQSVRGPGQKARFRSAATWWKSCDAMAPNVIDLDHDRCA